MLTGTYKEEYGEGAYGWHVERGAPPKPLGGRILKIECKLGSQVRFTVAQHGRLEQQQ